MNKAKIIVPTLLFLILLSLVVLVGVNSEPKSFIVQIAYPWDASNKITVLIKPGNKAVADKTFSIDVLHNNTRRVTATISWTETELQRGQKKEFSFAANSEEIQLFRPPSFNLKNIDKYFTVVIYTATSSQVTEYFPTSLPSFNWWFVWAPLAGIILFVVYIRILVSYLKEVRVKRRIETEEVRKRNEAYEEKKREEAELDRINSALARRQKELAPLLNNNLRLVQCINCENAMTREQWDKNKVCTTCNGDVWQFTHTEAQIHLFVIKEFNNDEPLPSDLNIKDIETRLMKNIKLEKVKKKAQSLRSQEGLLREQNDLLRDQQEETRRLRMVEEGNQAIQEEQLRELRERNRHD